MATVFQQIKNRRDTAANWVTVNPLLGAGEFGVETDTLKVKVGDGIALWNALAYLGADGGSLTDNANGTYTWVPAVGSTVTFGGVSSDAGNLLVLGADKKPMLNPAVLPQPATVAPLQGAQTAALGVSAKVAKEDHVHKETLTSLTYVGATKVLTYLDEAGNSTAVNLAALAADIYVNGASLNATTGILTLTDNDGTSPDVTVDLHALTGTLTNNGDGTYTYTTMSGTVTFDTKKAAVSADVGNALTLGADSLPYFAGTSLATVVAAALGTAAVGVSTKAAREDHVHKLIEFKELASLPALPVSTQLVGVTSAGAVTYFDTIDGGTA